jgi:uncharacterized protein (DUF1015 family)
MTARGPKLPAFFAQDFMITIRPFQALMPGDNVADVSAVPYDVVDREQAAAKAEGNALSFLRVSRSEIELSADTDPYSDAVYELAVANFAKLCATAPLTHDEHPSLYAYAQTMGEHRQIGLVAAASVDDYDADRIKKHEKTRQDKEDDRTRHTLELRAHSGPVFLTCRDQDGLSATLAEIANGDAIFDFVAADGVRHEVWRVPTQQTEELVQLFTRAPALYVADGHHRAKSASRTREACRAANPEHSGSEAYNYFLTVIFPGDQLAILAYNRAVHDLNGHTPESLREAIAAAFAIETTDDPVPQSPGNVCMYLAGAWYALKPLRPVDGGNVADALDVSVLQNRLLAPLLGIDDPRTSKRIDFVGGIHGTARLEELVDSGRAAVAFSMHPVTVDELMAIADAGMIMPPKSTWFEPKLRDGLLIHTF